MPTKQIAEEFFKQWAKFSFKALKLLAPKCPKSPGKKTRPWADGVGPQGLALHYTGGPDGIASIRWSNENRSNTGSSWHATCFDFRLPDLDQLLDKYPLVKQYLPATAILHADIRYGTWHGNWTNSMTFGLENRNLGGLTAIGEDIYRQSGSRKYYCKEGKDPVLIRGQWWEPFTREQLISNINIGKMLRALRGEAFKKSWVIPHQAFWAVKSDVGSAYPVLLVRESIFADRPVEEMSWLKNYGSSLTQPFSNDLWPFEDVETSSTDPRDMDPDVIAYQPQRAKDFDEIAGSTWRAYLPAMRANLELLGLHTTDESSEPVDDYKLDATLRLAVEIFQRSTHAKGYKNALTVDGIPGMQTRVELEHRLRRFGYGI